jgi:hypothetical protein
MRIMKTSRCSSRMTLAMHFLPAKAASLSDSFESWSPVRRFFGRGEAITRIPGGSAVDSPNDPDEAGARAGFQDWVAGKAVGLDREAATCDTIAGHGAIHGHVVVLLIGGRYWGRGGPLEPQILEPQEAGRGQVEPFSGNVIRPGSIPHERLHSRFLGARGVRRTRARGATPAARVFLAARAGVWAQRSESARVHPRRCWMAAVYFTSGPSRSGHRGSSFGFADPLIRRFSGLVKAA